MFVSHNVGAILSLTNKSVLLNKGVISFIGKSEDCVSKYLSSSYESSRAWQSDKNNNKPMQILSCQVLGENGSIDKDLDVRKKIICQIKYEIRQPIRSACIAINLHASDGIHLMSLEDIAQNENLREYRKPGIYLTQVELPGLWLNSGRYLLSRVSARKKCPKYDI